VSNRGAYGQLRYTLPDGWANSDDWPGEYFLVPSDEYAKADGSLDTWHGIYVAARPEAMLQDAQCTNGPMPGVGRTLDALTAWVAGHPGLDATAPQDLTIGGHPAKMVDFAVAADWAQDCPDAPHIPTVDLFREARQGEPQWNWGIRVGERMRIILVDVGLPGDPRVVLVSVDDTSDPSRFGELVSKAMPIIETFQFPD
jgi:hypothetical protein